MANTGIGSCCFIHIITDVNGDDASQRLQNTLTNIVDYSFRVKGTYLRRRQIIVEFRITMNSAVLLNQACVFSILPFETLNIKTC